VESAGKRFGLEILRQITGGTGAECFQELVLVRRVREDDDFGLGYTRCDSPYRTNGPSGQIGVDEAERRSLA
jgi:hypothetical protein